MELRTGLTTKEVGQFAYAARCRGRTFHLRAHDARALGSRERYLREEQQGPCGHGAARRGDARRHRQPQADVADPDSDLGGTLEAAEGVQRDTTAIELFKRAGLEAIPVISKLSENVARAKQLGLGATEEDVRRWEQYHRNIAEAEIMWERFVRKIKEPLAATIVFFFKDHTGRAVTLDDLKKMGINVARYEHNENDFWAAAEKQGFHRPEWVANKQREDVLNTLRQRHVREAGDEAVSGYYAEKQRDPAYRLKEAEEALSKTERPKAGVSSQEDVRKYADAEHQVEQLKQLVEQTRKLREEQVRLQNDLEKARVEVGREAGASVRHAPGRQEAG